MPSTDPFSTLIRCNYLLGSLAIESYISALVTADLSAMMGHQAAQQACQRAPALPTHLCSTCMLLLAPATMRAAADVLFRNMNIKLTTTIATTTPMTMVTNAVLEVFDAL